MRCRAQKTGRRGRSEIGPGGARKTRPAPLAGKSGFPTRENEGSRSSLLFADALPARPARNEGMRCCPAKPLAPDGTDLCRGSLHVLAGVVALIVLFTPDGRGGLTAAARRRRSLRRPWVFRRALANGGCISGHLLLFCVTSLAAPPPCVGLSIPPGKQRVSAQHPPLPVRPGHRLEK